MQDNSMIKKQLNHRSIRFFKDQALEEGQIEEILNVAQRTASSTGMQAVSLIRVRQAELKKKLMKVVGQEYIAEAPELWIFIVDLYRNRQIAREMGSDIDQVSMNHFFQGLADAYLMAQNMMNAIEALDLGGCFLGNILNDSERVIELLKLPQYTFPILGVIFGIPNDSPQLKPRLDMDLRVSEDSYQLYDSYLDEIAGYDEEMTTYYDTRLTNQRSDTFSKQVKRHMEVVSENRDKVLKVIEKQGFDLGL